MYDMIRFVEMAVWYITNDTCNYMPVVCRNVDCQHFVLVTGLKKLGSDPTHMICSKRAKICKSAGMTL